MKSYLSTLNEREKWMVLGAALCIFVYIYYLLLYSPLASQVEARQVQLIEKMQTLEWLNKVKNIKSTKKVKQSVDNSQLLTLLATQLKNSTTLRFPYQLQQTSSGEIQLSFDQVPFKVFMEWLVNINNKYNINIKQFDVNKSATPGITQLMIILNAA